MKNLSIKDLKATINLGWLNIDGVDNQDELRARLEALELELQTKESIVNRLVAEDQNAGFLCARGIYGRMSDVETVSRERNAAKK